MGFWGSLFGGSNPTLTSAIGKAGQAASFETGLGEKNISQASDIMSAIASGDQAKTAKFLAPQFNTIQQQGQQQKNAGAQFGNRSGGTNAANQMIGDKQTAAANDFVSSLMGSSLSGLASTGSSLLSEGSQSLGQQVGFSQQQMENWANSILGRGITSSIASAEAFGMGAAGGALPGGTGAAKGGMAAMTGWS